MTRALRPGLCVVCGKPAMGKGLPHLDDRRALFKPPGLNKIRDLCESHLKDPAQQRLFPPADVSSLTQSGK